MRTSANSNARRRVIGSVPLAVASGLISRYLARSRPTRYREVVLTRLPGVVRLPHESQLTVNFARTFEVAYSLRHI